MVDTADASVPMTHAGYLKLYQLSKPCLSRDFDMVLLDEAQDSNPASADVVLSQACPKILVGDSHQSIYSFIGQSMRSFDQAIDDSALYPDGLRAHPLFMLIGIRQAPRIM